ncbi:MAG TPA: OmpW family outer membrane protein [Nitrospiria bacterium]
MKHLLTLLFVLFVWAIFPADEAHSQVEAGRFALGLTVSAVTSTEGSMLGDKIEVARVSMPEVSLTYFISEAFSVELSHGRYETTLESRNGNFDYGDLEVSPTRLALEYRHNFGTPRPFWDVSSAYFAMGADYFSTDFKTSDEARSALGAPDLDISFKNSMGGHFGAGMDLFLARFLAFNLDGKVWFSNSEAKLKGVPVPDKSDFSLNAYSVGAGFKVMF